MFLHCPAEGIDDKGKVAGRVVSAGKIVVSLRCRITSLASTHLEPSSA